VAVFVCFKTYVSQTPLLYIDTFCLKDGDIRKNKTCYTQFSSKQRGALDEDAHQLILGMVWWEGMVGVASIAMREEERQAEAERDININLYKMKRDY